MWVSGNTDNKTINKIRPCLSDFLSGCEYPATLSAKLRLSIFWVGVFRVYRLKINNHNTANVDHPPSIGEEKLERKLHTCGAK